MSTALPDRHHALRPARCWPGRPLRPRRVPPGVTPHPEPVLRDSCRGLLTMRSLAAAAGQSSRLRPEPGVPARSPKTSRRRSPTWSAARPATPAARMTHRERSKCTLMDIPPLPSICGSRLPRRKPHLGAGSPVLACRRPNHASSNRPTMVDRSFFREPSYRALTSQNAA